MPRTISETGPLLLEADRKLRERCSLAALPVGDNSHISHCSELLYEIEDKCGIYAGSYMVLSNAPVLVVPDIPFKPAEISILSEDLSRAFLSSATPYSAVWQLYAVFDEEAEDPDSITVDDCVVTRVYDEDTQLWNIRLSFEEYNATNPDLTNDPEPTPSNFMEKMFQYGYEYKAIVLATDVNCYAMLI